MATIYLLFLLHLLPYSDVHDIHVSVADIEIEDQTIEITMKTFLDDLQLAMGLTPGEEIPDSYSSSDEMISNYILTTTSLALDGEDTLLNISSIDAAADAVWITIEVRQTDPIFQSLEWTSTFLTDIYDDQTNIVNIKFNGKRKVYSLNRKKSLVEFKLPN